MPPTVLTITSLKGGVGKSTTAVHLAKFFSSLGPTLLVDCDPNRSITNWAKRAEREGSLPPFTVITDLQMARVQGRFDFIINDTKGRPEEGELREMVMYSDLVVVPCFAEIQSMESLDLLAEKFKAMNTYKYRILLTNIPPAPQQDGKETRAYLESLNIPLFKGSIRSLKAFRQACLFGTTVDLFRKDPRSPLGWNDYAEVGEEIQALLGLTEKGSEASAEEPAGTEALA
jgi:chromosome partitioning protein